MAIAVIAIAIPSMLAAMMGHIEASAYMRDKLQAQWVAENQLAEIRIENRFSGAVPQDNQRGHTEMAGRQWYWERKVQSFAQAEFADIYGVEISVWEQDKKHENQSPLVSKVAIIKRRDDSVTISRPAPEVPPVPPQEGTPP